MHITVAQCCFHLPKYFPLCVFFFLLVVLMPRVLFLCMLGFSAFFADIPGLGFLVLHRLPPNNSTACAKVGPSYRPSSCKEPHAEHTTQASSSRECKVRVPGNSGVSSRVHRGVTWPCMRFCFRLQELPVKCLIVSPVVLITPWVIDALQHQVG